MRGKNTRLYRLPASFFLFLSTTPWRNVQNFTQFFWHTSSFIVAAGETFGTSLHSNTKKLKTEFNQKGKFSSLPFMAIFLNSRLT